MHENRAKRGILATGRAARSAWLSDSPPSRGAFRSAVPLIITAVALCVFDAQRSCAAEGDFAWGRSVGNDGDDQGLASAVDATGNVYVAGHVSETVDFDPGPGTYALTATPNNPSAFVLKLDASGDFVWARHMAGGRSMALALALDESGSVYMTGFFVGTVDFDPGEGTFELTQSHYGDVFVLKLDSSGDFVWAKQLHSAAHGGCGLSIAVDSSGNVCTTGWFGGTMDFDPGPGTFELTALNSQDMFVSKLDDSGDFVWARGIKRAEGTSLGVDSNGNVFVTGGFATGVDFDPGSGTATPTPLGASDIYVLKLDASGNYVWSRQFGGTSPESVNALTVDSIGNCYVTGSFQGTVDFDPGPGTANLTAVAYNDAFVAKLDESGNYVWAELMGGDSDEWGEDVEVDAGGNVHVGVYFLGTVDFDPGAGTYNLTSESANDICALKLDGTGSFQWARQVRCTDYVRPVSLAVGDAGDVFTNGYFTGTVEFDLSSGTGTLAATPGQDPSYSDIFVIKLSDPPVPPEVASVERAGGESTHAGVVDFTVNFDQDVTGVDANDFGITATGVAGASVANVTGSGDAYTVTVSTGTGDGTLRLDVVDDDTIVNAFTLPLGGAGPSNGNFSAGEVYTIDRTAPSAASSSAASALTNASPVPISVTFSEPVTGFTSSDVTATNASVTDFAGSGDTYAFGLLPAGQGVVTAGIAGGVCADAAGNLNEAAEALSRTYDTTNPEMSITSAETSPTNCDPIPLTLTFNRDMTGFTSGVVTVTNGTLSNFASITAALYTVDVHPSGQGEVRLDIAAGAANSVAGNPNLAGSYEIIYDSQPPVIAVLGKNPARVHRGETYIDAGATAYDLNDGDVSSAIVTDSSAVDAAMPGIYQVSYNVSDAAGNAAPQATREVEVLAEGAALPLNPLPMFLAMLFTATARLGLRGLNSRHPPPSCRH